MRSITSSTSTNRSVWQRLVRPRTMRSQLPQAKTRRASASPNRNSSEIFLGWGDRPADKARPKRRTSLPISFSTILTSPLFSPPAFMNG